MTWRLTKTFLRSNISDDTAFCYRIALLQLIAKQQLHQQKAEFVKNLVLEETAATLKTITELEGNESLWRYLFGLKNFSQECNISLEKDDESTLRRLLDIFSEDRLEASKEIGNKSDFTFWVSLGVTGWQNARKKACKRHALNYLLLLFYKKPQSLLYDEWDKAIRAKLLSEFDDLGRRHYQ
ncbi:hypothetical protein BC829DRAFT_418423 [Chytridium lagenaria]|nr:hypothetical protein BC829DRAFT_418423 [Chytridium lagenaria]